MSACYTISQIRDIVVPIAVEHGVKSVSLFGSYALNRAREDSDVDLKIEKGRLKSLLDLSRFRLAVEDALRLPVDLVTTQCSDIDFLREIEKSEVLLYREA
ncbi:MAG: nucleotidyltransferase domain-containing protein [Clostridia bacterium]|nr:nucleotidyltransferase domain-containing protein [Clostridia bacterium]